MTMAINQLGVEPLLIVDIDWGNQSTFYSYADRGINELVPPAGTGILVAATISKKGTLGSSGVSKTLTVTLDDTEGNLKTYYDSYIIVGSDVNVYEYFTSSQSPAIKKLIFKGKITSDVIWSEGERTLEIGIEEGAQTGKSRDLGYAPEENAFIGLNPNAVGVNWPIVFGTAVKVPAVRIEYFDDLTTAETVDKNSATFEINNGDQLPQSPTVITITIDKIIFTGTMSGNVFTVVTRNDPKYVTLAFDARPVGPDAQNATVAWLASLTANIVGLYCVVTINGQQVVNFCSGQNGTKCQFTQAWPGFLAAGDTIDEAARWPRTSWSATYIEYTDGENLMLTIGKDGWVIRRDSPVIYNYGGDVYVCNLYPSTDIVEVWGKRKFYNKTIWAKIPSSYYTATLDYEIDTDPGAVERHITILSFITPLSAILCEGWLDEVYVTLTSSLSNVPKDIVEWVVTNFTTYTFGSGTSDNPPVTMNFAYFETTDAIEFLEALVWQAASTLIISNGVVSIRQLAKTPGTGTAPRHDLPTSVVIMKTLVLGTKVVEEVNTKITAEYVTDYSGEKTANGKYIAQTNTSEFGVNKKTYDMFALTCYNAVKAVADFWSYRDGNSWKTLKCDCVLKASDFEVFDNIRIQLASFIANNTNGILTSVDHNTDSDIVSIEAEFAIKSGETSEDSGYWTLGTATCVTPTGTEIDYTPDQDDSCPAYSYAGDQTTGKPYRIVVVHGPVRCFRNELLVFQFEIWDDEDTLVADTSDVEMWFYTNSPSDCFDEHTLENGNPVNFVAGEATVITTKLQLSKMPGILRIYAKPVNRQIKKGEVYPVRKV